MKTLPSPRRFPQARRFCLLAVLMSFALNLCAPSGGTVRYDLGMFTIELPEDSREIDSEEARQEGCLGWVTPGKDFVCAICFFRFDEGFNPETRFQEEADGLKFDLESSAELPFEHNYYIKAGETVCWFIQREKMSVIEERGLPDYLRLEEEKMLMTYFRLDV